MIVILNTIWCKNLQRVLRSVSNLPEDTEDMQLFN
jgi:hypothetical protein